MNLSDDSFQIVPGSATLGEKVDPSNQSTAPCSCCSCRTCQCAPA